MALLLTAKDICLEFPTKKVFDSVTLGVQEGDRVGIVGKNGDGKSTLLSTLSKQVPLDAGEILFSGSPRIGVLRQTDGLNDEDPIELAVVGEAATYTWAANKKAREIIQALIGDIPWEARIDSLSGGQRRRVDLARLLIQDWDVLMLDEPTNHLDMKAIAWLANHLQHRWPKNAGALLVVTHDRWFLDEVALSMWEVHDGKVDPFEGGFSAYVQQRVERDRVIQVTEEKRQNLMRKELAWLSRGARARSSKPKFHLKAALEVIEGDPPVRDSIELKQMAMTRLGKQVFELKQVTETFDDHIIIKDLDWLIGPGDRYGILGENGAGKSTLLNLLAGKLSPTSGSIKVGKTVKLAMLSQHLEELEGIEHDLVREVLGRHKTRLVVDGRSVTSAQLLERLGFQREHLQSRVSELSGGQKRRLQLLLTLVDEPNVLILDEPGNDMDTDMLAVMEDLLDSWPGTLLLVSHDRYLMERVTDDQFALIDGTIKHMPGGVDEYLSLLAQREEQAAKTSSSNPKETAAEEPRAEQKLSGGEAYKARKELATLERKMNTLETQAETIAQEMHMVDPSDYLTLGELEKKLQDTKAQLSRLEDEWIQLSEKLDQP